MSYRSWCITIRPRDGLSDKTLEAAKKWLSKLTYSFAVLEMQNEARHLHAQIWFDEAKVRGDICKQIQRICERTIDDWDDAQKKVLRNGVRIAYSDWYLDYLAENDLKNSPNIILENPPDRTLDYYPTEEEQQNIQTMTTAVDPRFASLEIKFNDWVGEREISLKSVSQFLAIQMFQDRTIKVLLHQRDRKALAVSLLAYVQKSNDIYLFMDKDKSSKNIENFLATFPEPDSSDSEEIVFI